MAGKTLRGIGDDESGEHEIAADKSGPSANLLDSSLLESADKSGKQDESDKSGRAHVAPDDVDTDKASLARSTDRMPFGTPARSTDRMPLGTIYNGPAIDFPPAVDFSPAVDEDKVAEGLKKLRSLDEPLGPIPSSMPTLKEGMPVVATPTPTPTPTPASSVADLIRARGTAHGHALSAAGAGQGLVPVAVDDRFKGTLLGHSLHLPDLPEPGDDNRPAEVRSVAQLGIGHTATTTEMPADFSRGDSSFFESEPVNQELEPEAQPRSTVVARGAVFVAIISIFVVAAVAWVKVHKGADVADAPPTRVADPTIQPFVPPPPAPDPVPNPVPNNVGVPVAAAPTPTEAAGAVPAPAPPVAVAPARPTPAAPAAAPDEQAAVDAPAPPPVPRHARQTIQDLGARPPRVATHSPRPTESHHTAAERPAVPVKAGKPKKSDEDPDGTLPLDE